MIETTLLGAIILGLMGASHCISMCGGIIGSLSLATDQNQSKWSRIVSYQFGRITSYALFGLIAGILGQQASQLSTFPILKYISAILLLLMGLYVSRVWMLLTVFEKAGKLLWNKISPLSKKLLPVTSIKQAILLGALWGWLPCGLVYTSLGYAVTTANPIDSALFMLAFGVGTLPATLVAGAASLTLKEWLNKKPIRMLSALVFIGLGSYMLFELLTASTMTHHHH